MTSIELNDSQWKQIALSYKQGKLPILVECNRDEGKEDCLMKQEVSEFLDRLGRPGISFAKRGVINHLKKTAFIIACQLPTADIDDDGYDANGCFLSYFVQHCGGMIQADGEGFYEGHKLIVKLE
ncbi:MAG TPA: hypothetical protein VIH42_06200 [Thermoguttaceae bacterium]